MEQLIRKYRNKELYSLNCAEAILYAANEYYNLELSTDALYMVAGFGGGIKEEHLCGIISGAVSVLSVLFKGKYYNEEDVLTLSMTMFKDLFKEQYTSLDCSYLKVHHKEENTGCDPIILETATMLRKVIDYYLELI